MRARGAGGLPQIGVEGRGDDLAAQLLEAQLGGHALHLGEAHLAARWDRCLTGSRHCDQSWGEAAPQRLLPPSHEQGRACLSAPCAQRARPVRPSH